MIYLAGKSILFKYMEKSTFKLLLALSALLLLFLPFVTTFNEILTVLIMKVRLYRLIQEFIVPFEAKMVTVILRLFGITAFPTLTSVKIGSFTTVGNNVTISWNCVGWQSFILLVITFLTGLQGSFRLTSKIQTIVIGVLGTFLINILRISLVVIFAYRVSPVLALIFHDYFSTILIIIWLFFFWWFSYNFVLEKEGET